MTNESVNIVAWVAMMEKCIAGTPNIYRNWEEEYQFRQNLQANDPSFYNKYMEIINRRQSELSQLLSPPKSKDKEKTDDI